MNGSNRSKWDNPTVRLLIVTLGIIVILLIFSSKFAEPDAMLKAIGLIIGVIAGDKFDLHKKVLNLFRDPAPGDENLNE